MNTNRAILLIEDDQIDRMTIQRGFRNLNIKNKLDMVKNGQEGLEYLRKSKENPTLIILDINMPKMNGLEFLGIIKKNEEYKTIPVFILTTSNDENDKRFCYECGIAGYILKPIDYLEFQETIKILSNYWDINKFIT